MRAQVSLEASQSMAWCGAAGRGAHALQRMGDRQLPTGAPRASALFAAMLAQASTALAFGSTHPACGGFFSFCTRRRTKWTFRTKLALCLLVSSAALLARPGPERRPARELRRRLESAPRGRQPRPAPSAHVREQVLGFDLRNTTMLEKHWDTITNTAALGEWPTQPAPAPAPAPPPGLCFPQTQPAPHQHQARPLVLFSAQA